MASDWYRDWYTQEKILSDERKKLYLRLMKSHPNRTHQYDLALYPPKPFQYDYVLPGWRTTDFMRHLSNVSVKFRHELAEVVWANVAIKIDFEAVLDGSLQAFLTDRPAIHRQIRSIHLSIDMREYPDLNLREAFSVESAFMKLEFPTLRIHFVLYECELEDFISGTGLYKDLEVIRHVRVTRSFEPSLDPVTTDEDYDFDGPYGDKYRASLAAKHLPTVRALLLPNSLRGDNKPSESSESKTEKERYLDARKVLVSGSGSEDICQANGNKKTRHQLTITSSKHALRNSQFDMETVASTVGLVPIWTRSSVTFIKWMRMLALKQRQRNALHSGHAFGHKLLRMLKIQMGNSGHFILMATLNSALAFQINISVRNEENGDGLSNDGCMSI
ncbi:hypothetical protein BKA65DRAFT_533222 [Rhexocercosporidium sp. MPI-PUGE-AT-0058]|nr:hypothetical protein BKA65DRAFT_533222 [Rhexocercosporidium sp. MPI-PUGE-AT-0058]